MNESLKIAPKFDHVMVDLETLGALAGCAVLSIGAVAFDHITGILGPEFYQVINEDTCTVAGLEVDQDTQAWWRRQSEAAQVVWHQANDLNQSEALSKVLKDFNIYLSKFGDNVKVWGNGSDFDNAILYAAYAAVNVPVGWKFRNSRCFRTLKNLINVPAPDRVGIYHNALDDAKTQAIHANALLGALNGVTHRGYGK